MQLLAEKRKPGRDYARLDVTRLASGAELRLGLHTVTGTKAGPTLGILATVHGDETMGLMAVRRLLQEDLAHETPLVRHQDADGNFHVLYRVDDPDRIARYQKALDVPAAIADGRHRELADRVAAAHELR